MEAGWPIWGGALEVTKEFVVTIAPATIISHQQVVEAVSSNPDIPSQIQDAAVGFILGGIGSRLSDPGEQTLQLQPELVGYHEQIANVITQALEQSA